MTHKILFTDLDGTLLRSDRTVSDRNKEAITRMLSLGHYLALATGRSVESARSVARSLGLDMPGCYMVAFNGAVLYDCAADQVLFKRSLPIEVVQEIFERARRAGIYCQTYTSTDIVTTRHTEELDFYRMKAPMSYKIAPNALDLLQEEPQKVLLLSIRDRRKLERFRQENLAWEIGRCTSNFSCREFLEYSPLGTSKATGIESLIKILNMPLDATVAVGDEENDISMIQGAHVGVAVQNGIDAIKEAADYVTEQDNEHDAVAEVIEKFVL